MAMVGPLWMLGEVRGGSGGCRAGGSPRISEGGAAEGGHDVGALFAGGVDVGADVESVLGDVFAGQSPGDFCCVLVGRRSRSLMLFVGQIRMSSVNRRTSAWRS